MRRVTGIGGVFFSAKDQKALVAWFVAHRGSLTALRTVDSSSVGITVG